MVTNKAKARISYFLFIFPAVGFYFVFAIVPLLQGVMLSTMNWDGTAPWTPAQLDIAEFENKILDKLTNAGDRDFVLKYYRKNESQGTYQKQALYGIDRYRMQAIISGTGYVNENFKFIGLDNYVSLFQGKADPRFFPERYSESRFQAGSPVEELASIPAGEYENNLIKHVRDPLRRDFLKNVYTREGNKYVLDKRFYAKNETDLQLELSVIAGFEQDWEEYYQAAIQYGSTGSKAGFEQANLALNAEHPALAKNDIRTIITIGNAVYELNFLKNTVSTCWYVERFKMGVLLFTLFFSVLNVTLVNVLALLLALGLDVKLKTRHLLRSAYFIPNVLSMIVVAFIWKLVFTQLLPAVTGIQSWIMNPDAAPWLTVFVATWQGLGYYIIIYLAGLQAIPQDLLEAAAVEGTPIVPKFIKIILPLLLPSITVCLFFSIAGSLKSFDIIFALYPSNSTSMGVDNLVINIFYDAFRDRHASLAIAKALCLNVVIILITGVQLMLSKRKELEL